MGCKLFRKRCFDEFAQPPRFVGSCSPRFHSASKYGVATWIWVYFKKELNLQSRGTHARQNCKFRHSVDGVFCRARPSAADNDVLASRVETRTEFANDYQILAATIQDNQRE
jgi:hypothetical protein